MNSHIADYYRTHRINFADQSALLVWTAWLERMPSVPGVVYGGVIWALAFAPVLTLTLRNRQGSQARILSPSYALTDGGSPNYRRSRTASILVNSFVQLKDRRQMAGTAVMMTKNPYSYDSGYQDGSYDVRSPVVKPKAAQAIAPPMRRPLAPLERRAHDVLVSLPADCSLAFTAENFPHLVNQIAFLWDDAKALDLFVEALMIDDRGNRAGFPFEAIKELTKVRDLRVVQLTGRRDF